MKPLHSSSTPRRAVTLLIAALVCIGQADAKKRPAAKAKGKGAKASLFDPGELGATRSKFETWQRGVLGGDAFYTKADRALKSNHSTIANKIQKAHDRRPDR